MSTVLIIDDNHAVCEALELLLSLQAIRALSAETPEAGLRLLDASDVDMDIQAMHFTEDLSRIHICRRRRYPLC